MLPNTPLPNFISYNSFSFKRFSYFFTPGDSKNILLVKSYFSIELVSTFLTKTSIESKSICKGSLVIGSFYAKVTTSKSSPNAFCKGYSL